MRVSVRWLLWTIVLLGLARGAAAAESPCWSIVESGPSRLTIEIEVAEPTETSGAIQVAGFPGQDLLDSIWVPTLGLPIAVPPDGEVSIRAVVEGLHPVSLGSGRGTAVIGPAPPTRRRPVDGLGFVEHSDPSWAADLRLVTLQVYALRPGADGEWMAPQRIRIDCEFTTQGTRGALGRIEGAGRGMRCHAAINATQAEGWRRVPAPAPAFQRGDGFDSATNPWVRLRISQRGLYEITSADLDVAGIDPGDVVLTQLRLFCGAAGALPDTGDSSTLPDWMEPCALLIEDDGDGAWDAATHVYFLGNGPDGWRSDLDVRAPEPIDRYYSHPYSNFFTYWLTWGGNFTSEPSRMAQVAAPPEDRPLLEVASGRVHHEENRISVTRPRELTLDWPRFYALEVRANLADLGASVTVPLPGLRAGTPATAQVALWGSTWGVAGAGNDHDAFLKVNGTRVASAQWDDTRRRVVSVAVDTVRATNLVSLYVTRRPDEHGDPISDGVLLDWVEFDYRKRLEAEQDSLEFWAPAAQAADSAYRVSGLSSANGWLLLDASSFRQPRLLAPQVVADGAGFAAEFALAPAGEAAHLVLVPRARAARPAAIERVNWEDGWLRRRTGAIDYLIVTAAELNDPAETMRAHRALRFYGADGDTEQTARVALIDVEQVFDEFSWGQHDPVALRDFIAYARTHWRGEETAPPLSHVLLLGDAYYDARDHLKAGGRDLVPGYLWYDWRIAHYSVELPDFYGDDWFGLLDGPEDDQVDLAIGRLPAANDAQAFAMVRKVIANETAPERSAWRTRLLFSADDICQGNEPDDLGYAHMSQSERLCLGGAPLDASLEKIYLFEYGAQCRYERKPQATQDLLDLLAQGALLFNFVGHGSEIQLATERLLELSSLSSLGNYDRPFLMVTASCAVGKFAQGGDGLGVQALRLANRGALAVVSATSTASSYANFNLNLALLQALFPDRHLLPTRAFGPALVQAKWVAQDNDNDLRYNLLGDPGSRFAVPDGSVELHLEGVPGVPADADTLVRGGAALLRGRVLDPSGAPEANFSGEAEVLVLDSDILRSPSPDIPSHDYQLPGARVFSGTVPVSGGEFACPFFVPTALRSGPRGPARVYVYAKRIGGSGSIRVRDAGGARAGLFIPEEREPGHGDTLGPVIELSWENPAEPPRIGSRVLATLTDSSGIYVAALTPSRSVVVTVQDPDGRMLVARDLAAAVTFGSDYREASLTYALPSGLPSGKRLTLKLAASDNLGRRSDAALVFHIGAADTLRSLLSGVFNIPNPTQGTTRFLFEIAREADLEVAIYTVTGHRIVRLPGGSFAPARAREVGIPWDGRDEDGDPVANGLYFYRAIATDGDRRREERIDRLVILR